MKKEHSSSMIAQMIFMMIGKLKALKKLKITGLNALKKTNIEILNS